MRCVTIIFVLERGRSKGAQFFSAMSFLCHWMLEWWRRWRKPPDECFICCTEDGKTENELKMDKANRHKSWNYPLLSMAHVYGCQCIGSLAHNRCLLSIHKCPTCRKDVQRPNLCVAKTKFDVVFAYLLQWLRQDPNHVEVMTNRAAVVFFVSFVFFGLITHDFVEPPKDSLVFNVFFWTLFILNLVSLFLLIFVNDYVRKYWLYDRKLKKYHTF